MTPSQNCLYKSSHKSVTYVYADEIPNTLFLFILYQGIEYEGYFMCPDGYVWFNKGERFRKLFVKATSRVSMFDIDHLRRKVSINGLRRKSMFDTFTSYMFLITLIS